MIQSDFECGIIVGASDGGFSISKTTTLLGFPCILSSTNREWQEKNNNDADGNPVSSSSVAQNTSLMIKVREELPYFLKLTGRPEVQKYNSSVQLLCILQHLYGQMYSTDQPLKWFLPGTMQGYLIK